ncbi:MAG TPA: 2-oxoglutarate dehydrogenase E1 component [Phycisphaerales bacterium]|nr:2-oxoglutarate dehydrogenase E1 component [Phycisphaerales bacterium]
MRHGQNPAQPRAVSPAVNGWNAEFLDAEYARFKADPGSVSPDLAAFFQGFDLALGGSALRADVGGVAATSGDTTFQRSVDSLVTAYRTRAHLAAKLDPFDRERTRPPELSLAYHGLSDADLDRPANSGVSGLAPGATLRQTIEYLEATYCSTIGVEFMHINNAEERAWFRERFERVKGRTEFSREHKLAILNHLAASQAFETFVGIKYGQGMKWFSLEGGTSTIPTLEMAIEHLTDLNAEEVVLGMAHRGRVNVLNTVMGKTYEQLFTEFEDNWDHGYLDGGGDVKYHRGYSITRKLANGKSVRMAMASNPSHLEAVNPVVLGRTRAKQRLRNDTQRTRVVPMLLHGDGAVIGQGVVWECLNMSQIEGYTVGGCIHLVINNLIAFTTLPEDDRSTPYPTDITKGIECPVFHVNGEDPEACAFVARLAAAYRQQFKKDVFIDLWCYRKYGHNESDEQSYTQPILASLIKAKTPTAQTYAAKLIKEGVLTQQDFDAKNEALKATLEKALASARREPTVPVIDPGNDRWKGITGDYSHTPAKTGVSMQVLTEVCNALGRVPETFNLNPKLKKLLTERAELPKNGMVSHADAELLAFGTLLLEGTPVRLSGQDCRRGTFSQRHAVFRDFSSSQPYVPLNNMREVANPGEWKDGKQARFCVYDSPLSEFSVLGFDYGYSLADPNMLVLWEAQFGDFDNGAQVIIDQFIASSEIKWNRWSGLVMLLPHGYEGAGPEHSSARIERFLSLCGDDNMQVCNPTTAAQHFHMLRRQVKRNFRKPLIVAAPKKYLRTPTSHIDEFTTGTFREVLDDPAFDAKNGLDRSRVTRVIICSGKVFHELSERRKATGRTDVAILRLEQLYPFHTQMVKETLAKYPKKAEVVYVQEEPRNAGAYLFVADQFKTELGIDLPYIGRDTSATPAVGSKKADYIQQEAVIAAAIGPSKKADAPAEKVPAPAKPQVAEPARR